MKKRTAGISKKVKTATALIAAAAVVSGTFVWQSKSGTTQAASGSTLTYQVNEVTNDEISVNVSGSGTLSPVEAETFTAAYAGTVQAVQKSVGDTVEAGEVIAAVYSDQLESQLSALNTQLASVNTQLSNTSKTASSKYIKAGASGEVKLIKGASGEVVEDVMSQYGNLCVISTDGKMLVTFTTDKDVKKYDTVSVSIGESTEEGTVVKKSGTEVTAEIEENSYTVGETASVSSTEGTVLGEGKLKLSEYTAVTSNAGVIDSVLVEENDTVSSSTKLFLLTDYPVSTTYEALKEQQETLEEQIETLEKNKNISVDYAGKVTDMQLTAGQSVAEGDSMCTVQGEEGYQLAVSVDELDIADITKGAKASITVDALEGTYEGSVTYVSNVGNTESNVTTYEVKIQTEEIEGALSGMSATATITAESSGEALVVPVDAVQKKGGESFLYLADSGVSKGDELEEGDVDTESLKTVTVTTGMTDGSYIVVEGDVSEGDLILVPTLTTTEESSGSSEKEQKMGGQMSGQMPGGMDSGKMSGERGGQSGAEPPAASGQGQSGSGETK